MTAEIPFVARLSGSARLQTLRALLVRHADIVCMVALALISAVYCLQYDILRQPIPHDTTFHIYAAQQMLDGHPIYRDVAIVKAPLSDFVSVFALLVARAIHISDIMGTRLMSLMVVMATASATYLAGKVLFQSRAVGIFAGLIMAFWNFYGMRAVTGPEPKAFVILFSMLGLVCIAQKRWGWAGVCAALSTLAWQPALMLQAIAMGAAFIAPWLETNRPPTAFGLRMALKNNVRVSVGFLVPFAVVIFYLAVNSALLAAYHATIGANVNHVLTTQARVPLFETLDKNLSLIILDGRDYCFSPNEYWLVGLGILGFIGLGGAQILGAVRAKRPPLDLAVSPLLLYTLGFVAFTLYDFDFCPDLFPLFPIVALGFGVFVFAVARALLSLIARFSSNWDAGRVKFVLLVVLAALIVWVYGFDVWGYRITGTSFLDQLAVAQAAEKYVGPNDRILTFGNTIVLIQMREQNASKILHLGSKSGLGVLVSEPGGVQGMVDALDQNPPKLVTLARETRLDWTKPFYDWLARRYKPVDVFPRANMRFFVLKQ